MHSWSWDSFSPLDLVVLAVTLLLAASAIARSRTPGTNRMLLAANWAVVISLSISLTPVYSTIDPMLGGHNYINILQRLFVAYAGYAVTYSLAQTAMKVLREEKRPFCMSKLWIAISAAGIGIAFVGMEAARFSSRGLNAYAHDYVFFTLYQCSTLAGLLAGTVYLLPRLKTIISSTDSAPMKMQLRIFLLSYITASATAILFVLTPLSPLIVPLREGLIYFTFASLAAGFMIINKELRAVNATQGRLQRA